MSAARADNAARELLARLTDEAELESVPLEEVRADLVLLGIDPERAVRFSRRLAEQAASPAAGLLAKALAAEDDERELAAFEDADIGAVRAELTAATPLGVAQAQRLASRIAQSAPQRRSSRRLWYGIGGAITAIAASVLIVVHLSSRVEHQQLAYAPEDELASTPRGALEQPASSSKSTAPASPVPVAGAADTGTNAAPVSDGAATRSERQYDRIAGAAATEEARPDTLAIDVLTSIGATEGASSFRAPQPVAESEFADLTASAALILQPELAPEPLRQSDLGEGNLASRLQEVARLPFNQYIVALVTLERADGTAIDGMLYHLPVEDLQALRKSEAGAPLQEHESSALTEPVGPLPTLRQLLGEQGSDFRLVKLNPSAAAGQQ